MIIVCVTCGVEVEAKSKNKKYCANCSLKNKRHFQANSYQKNREHYIAKSRQYQQENKEAVLQKKREAYQSNIEVHKTRDKERRVRDRVKRNAAKKAYYGANKSRILQTMATAYAQNPEPKKASVKKWAKENRVAARLQGHNKRARKRNARGTHTIGQFWTVCEHYGWKCVYCGLELTKDTVTEDHVIPLSRGGSNAIDNILPACRPCNSRKNSKTYEEYMKYIKRLS